VDMRHVGSLWRWEGGLAVTQLKLIRDVFEDDFTLSTMHTPWGNSYGLEDAVREVAGKPVCDWKMPGQTAIPMGNYRVIINFSNRFQKFLPLLLDVPGFAGVRIHAGNTHKDTEGCILLGQGRDNRRGMVTNSRAAMALFQPALQASLAKGDVWLQVI